MPKYLLIILIFAPLLVNAQEDTDIPDPMLIDLQGRILSTADSTPIPYANIILYRIHSGTTTNGDGYFSLEMLNIDSLEVTSVGYKKTILKVPSYYTGFETLTFYMEPILYNVGEVTVEGEARKLEYFEHGNPTDIPMDLRGAAYNEKPHWTNAIVSPGSFLYYHLNKKEKRKRDVLREMAITKNWEMHSKYYNKEMVMKLTGLNNAYADTFMVWFNSLDVLPYTSNEYEVREAITQYYKLFKIDYDLE